MGVVWKCLQCDLPQFRENMARFSPETCVRNLQGALFSRGGTDGNVTYRCKDCKATVYTIPGWQVQNVAAIAETVKNPTRVHHQYKIADMALKMRQVAMSFSKDQFVVLVERLVSVVD